MLTESGFFKESVSGGDAKQRSSVPPDLAPGKLIAQKYELLRKVGTGAMGEVWAAKHLSLDEEVAIKLVLRDVEHEDGSTADSRFLLEARVARMLSRKTRHIVSVTDHGDEGPVAYLVMELLSGEPLDVRLARSGALPVEKVVPVVQQVARALAVAHDAGIVHRDLKPGNVFLTLDEEGKPLIKILDFGIAKLSSRPPAADSDNSSALRNSMPDEGRPAAPHDLSQITNRDAKHATLRGFLLGTPAFMSPEQARGKALDHRADVWALAVITYHLLTTQFPFDGATPKELFRRLIRIEPFPITDHRQDLPPAMTDLFARAFARRIEDRFQSAEAFATALVRACGDKPVPTLAAKVESDIVAAGVPTGGAMKRIAAVAAVALLALGGGFAVSHLRETKTVASGLAAGATTEPSTTTTLTQNDELIPAPEPVEKAAAVEAPPPEPEAPAPLPPPPAVVEPEPAPPVVTAPPAPTKAPDKSEVF